MNEISPARLYFIFTLIAVIFVAYVTLGMTDSQQISLSRHAENVIETCLSESYPPVCYDEEIPKLMDQGLTMEEAFQVTSLVQERDPNYFYCHVLGHNLSAKETAKDPSRWTEVVARAPGGICSNGAIHGAFQERFRDDVLTDAALEDALKDVNTICEGNPLRTFTGLEKASCNHAIGHLLMYMTGADIQKATRVCDRMAEETGEDYTQMCYEGAYMQIFQPLEPEDFALVKDIAPSDKKSAEEFCDTFTGERRSACHRESWPHYREEIVNDASALHAFCSLVPEDAEITRCYSGMFYILAAQFNLDSDKIIALCETVPQDYTGQCFANSASRFIEIDYRLIDRAVDLCDVATEHGVGERCYKELLFYSSFAFLEGSPSLAQLCGAMPEPWRTRCFNGEGSSVILNEN